jgi:hypothetical protein
MLSLNGLNRDIRERMPSRTTLIDGHGKFNAGIIKN